jgi:restriction system protein
MRPLLALHEDGNGHSPSELRSRLASEFQLTEEEREERLPSGTQRTFDNRVGWASTYLVQTGLLNRPRRGITVMTERGRDVLRENPERIDLRVLGQFPEFEQFRTARRRPPVVKPPPDDGATPEEAMEHAYQELRETLAQELLARILSRDDVFFEDLVLDVLLNMGYGGSRREASERIGRTGDGGLDGVIREDRLGLDVIYVQAKRWDPSRPIRRPDIQAFVGALQGARANKGVFLTTSRFTADASEYVERVQPRVVLVDGADLAELMIDHGVGVSRARRYDLQRLDEDYFADEDGIANPATESQEKAAE